MRGWIGVALVLASGCIPSRDNPHDPAVRPDAEIDVRVEGDTSRTAGGRSALWELDATASDDPDGGSLARFSWAISAVDAGVPADVGGDWIELGAGNAADFSSIASRATATQASNGELAIALLSVDDFVPVSPADPAGTGVAGRWIRLRVTDRDGHVSSAHAHVTIVNRAPVVALGPDRRIQPGGDNVSYDPHVVEIQAFAHDPDERDDQLLFTPFNPGAWFVEGALAATLEHDPDGRVTDAAALVAPGRLRFYAPILPARSHLRFEISDQTGLAAGALGAADVHVDVLSSQWAYGAGDGQFTRLDTSRLVSSDEPTGLTRKILAADDIFFLAWTDAGGGRLSLMGPELLTYVADTAGQAVSAARVAPDSLEFFVLTNAGSIRLYSLGLSGLVSTSLPASFSQPSYGGANAKIVSGGADAFWVFVNDGAQVFRRPLSGAATVLPAFSDGVTLATEMVPDGDTGVWITGEEAGGADLVAHLQANGQTQRETITECGLAEPNGAPIPGRSIVGLAYDPVREALWISATGDDSALLCVRENGIWAEQSVAAAAPLTLNPVDGSVYMPFCPPDAAGDGLGFSRYAAGTADSLEYVPIDAPYRWWSAARLFATNDGSLATSVRGSFDSEIRYFWSEGGEIPAPQVVIPDIEPYQFDFVDFAIDPVTGFLWVWRPDLGAIEAWSPDGQLLRTVPLGLAAPGGEEVRGAIAIDSRNRTIWFAWAPRYTGTIPDDVGRLLSFEIPDVAIGPDEEAKLGQTEDAFAPVIVATDANLTFSLVWDLAVVPENGDTRLCIGGTIASEDYTSGFGSAYRVGDGSRVAFSTLVSDPEIPVQVAGDHYTGDCWFIPDEDEDFGGRIGVVDFNGTVTALTGYGTRVSRPHARGAVFGALRPAMTAAQFAAILTNSPSFTPLTATLESSFVSFNPSSLNIDPFYGHLFVGFDQGAVVRFQLRPTGPAEMAPFGPLSRPVLESP